MRVTTVPSVFFQFSKKCRSKRNRLAIVTCSRLFRRSALGKFAVDVEGFWVFGVLGVWLPYNTCGRGSARDVWVTPRRGSDCPSDRRGCDCLGDGSMLWGWRWCTVVTAREKAYDGRCRLNRWFVGACEAQRSLICSGVCYKCRKPFLCVVSFSLAAMVYGPCLSCLLSV